MEVTKEFFDCLTWASAAFVSGICLREWCKQMVGQWIGRANVAAALFVMSAFGLHSARQCSVLINLVEHSHANPVSDQFVIVAHQVKTKSGTIFEWTSDGRSGGAVRAEGRRFRGGSSPSGGGVFTDARAGNGFDALPNGTHESTTSATTGADATSDQIANAGRRF
jgi:hypothetical protein